MSFLIQLDKVSRLYESHTGSFHALKSVDLTVSAGEMVAVTGASGSGKSTLMNIIGLLDQVTHGHYFFSNQNVSHLDRDRQARIRNQKIGFIFQSFFLLPRLSAIQNVMLPLFYRGEEKHISQKKSHDMLEKMGMEKFIHHKPDQLSGGQQQRVAIARALVGNPELILADEPTGALDHQTGQMIMDILIELNQKENRTIVMVTHDREISRQCQRTVTLQSGSLA